MKNRIQRVINHLLIFIKSFNLIIVTFLLLFINLINKNKSYFHYLGSEIAI